MSDSFKFGSNHSGAPRLADRTYSTCLWPHEALAVRDEVREVARVHVAPYAAEIGRGDERVDGFPRSVFRALADEGLFRIPFASTEGGRGLNYPTLATVVAVEELAYYSNSIAAVFDVHCILAGSALSQGSPDQRNRWLPGICAGEVVGAFATSEPAASSDLSPSAVQTIAVPTATGWRLSGRKRWITNSVAADVAVVLARTDDTLTMFIVPTSAPGVSIGVPDRKIGNRGQITADLVLEDVDLGPEDQLGAVGEGLRVALRGLTLGRIGIGAAGVGMAQAAFDHAVVALTERMAFGRPVASNQHWQFLLAERATELTVARDLYVKAALRVDNGEKRIEPDAAMAKLVGSRLAVTMARDAVQALGGQGFVMERGADEYWSPIETIFRDSKIGEIYEGTNEIQKWIIAREVLGREFTG